MHTGHANTGDYEKDENEKIVVHQQCCFSLGITCFSGYTESNMQLRLAFQNSEDIVYAFL